MKSFTALSLIHIYCFPEGKRLGGAPINFCFFAKELGAESYPVTAIGEDELGDETFTVLKETGLDLGYISRNILPTGKVLDVYKRQELPRMLAAVRLHPSVRPGCRQVNTTQVNRVDITSVSSIFTADLELRQQIRLLTQFLKENLPGYENCRVIGSGTTTGVRESRRVMGDYVIDADAVSYTHLDVYKRQPMLCWDMFQDILPIR